MPRPACASRRRPGRAAAKLHRATFRRLTSDCAGTYEVVARFLAVLTSTGMAGRLEQPTPGSASSTSTGWPARRVPPKRQRKATVAMHDGSLLRPGAIPVTPCRRARDRTAASWPPALRSSLEAIDAGRRRAGARRGHRAGSGAAAGGNRGGAERAGRLLHGRGPRVRPARGGRGLAPLHARGMRAGCSRKPLYRRPPPSPRLIISSVRTRRRWWRGHPTTRRPL